MALSDILKKIAEEARKQADKIIAEGQEQVDKMRIMQEKKNNELRSSWEGRKNAKILELRRSFEKKRLLDKEGLLEQAENTCIKTSLASFMELLKKDEAFAAKVVQKIVQKLPAEPGKIITSPQVTGFVKKVAPASYEVVEDANHEAGFTVKFRTSELDCRFKTLIFSEYNRELIDKAARFFGFVA